MKNKVCSCVTTRQVGLCSNSNSKCVIILICTGRVSETESYKAPCLYVGIIIAYHYIYDEYSNHITVVGWTHKPPQRFRISVIIIVLLSSPSIPFSLFFVRKFVGQRFPTHSPPSTFSSIPRGLFFFYFLRKF